MKLVKGKQTFPLEIANGKNPHGFYFTLTSKEEIKLAKSEDGGAAGGGEPEK